MDHAVPRVLRFDRFALDLARGCLRAGDQDIDLRPKTFEVLCCLAGKAGRLVAKQELFEAVWPHVSVCDDSLVQCISELRQKLGDDDHRLIKTVSRRGYLLDVTMPAQAPQSLPDGLAVKPPEGPQTIAAKSVVPLDAARTIPVPKPHMWGAVGAGLIGVALGVIYLSGRPISLANPQASSEHVSLATHAPPVPQARPTFEDCVGCPEMVALPAGEFMMGSPADEPGHRDAEGLFRRHVVVPKPIAVGKFEVTIGQFAAFVAETGTSAGNLCRAIVGDNGNPSNSFIMGPPEASFRRPGFAVTESHPVVCINWHDAQQYVAWLRRRTGKPYRLPTEAEWEYAARAGTQTMYSFGDDANPLCAHARFADVDNTPFPWRSGCGRDTAGPIPVGQLKPNPWGFFDMHGNAWEWVEDCWTPDTSKIPPDGSAFSTPSGSCMAHVIRGGSWANGPPTLRSAFRRGMNAEFRQNHFGFRIALSLDE
jgi:formylglycine-generating enzyme required for sulfatase activity/DNA-binding winged helix-turn-helix (wHTH) protein